MEEGVGGGLLAIGAGVASVLQPNCFLINGGCKGNTILTYWTRKNNKRNFFPAQDR